MTRIKLKYRNTVMDIWHISYFLNSREVYFWGSLVLVIKLKKLKNLTTVTTINTTLKDFSIYKYKKSTHQPLFMELERHQYGALRYITVKEMDSY